MLEMIVAIGIILILLGISVIGFRALDASASKKETVATLTNLQAMMAELESTGGVTSLVGPTGVYQRTEQADNPGDSVTGTTGSDAARYGRPVRRTQDVIRRLIQLPKNKTSLAQFSGKRLLGPVDANTTTETTMEPVPGSNPAKKTPSPPIPLDGWRNPILFVPSAGLKDVTPASGGTAQVVTAPGGRPFWASAGSDGNFRTGDDNIYSFNKE